VTSLTLKVQKSIRWKRANKDGESTCMSNAANGKRTWQSDVLGSNQISIIVTQIQAFRMQVNEKSTCEYPSSNRRTLGGTQGHCRENETKSHENLKLNLPKTKNFSHAGNMENSLIWSQAMRKINDLSYVSEEGISGSLSFELNLCGGTTKSCCGKNHWDMLWLTKGLRA